MVARRIAYVPMLLALLVGCSSDGRTWVWDTPEVNQTGSERGVADAGWKASASPPESSTLTPVPVSPIDPEGPTEPAEHRMPAPPPQARSQLVPFAVPAAAPEVAAASQCAIPGLTLPPDFKVYAAGAYSGRRLDYQIDQSGSAASQIDVAVNDESAPVVLMLGAYEPTVWNIGWSKRTRIVGVLVSGYHRQVIAGLPASVPRLISTYANKGPCGYFYLSEDQLERVNPLARQMFGQAVTRAFLARNGFVTVGNGTGSGFVTDSSQAPESFRDRDAPLAGEAGLRDAVAKGWLREARSSDIQAWTAAYDAANRRDKPPLSGASPSSGSDGRFHNAYVVLKPMQIPAGLYGAHSATFIVPAGVPRPAGNPGHSQILDYNTMTCAGLVCGRE